MSQANFQELLKQAAEREEARQASEIADAQLEVVTATFDRATAYSNLIILGGYAGYFGLWQLTKDHLTKQQALWSALLFLASLAAFVIFEVTKMVVIQKGVMSQAAVLRSPEARKNPQALLKKLEALGQVQVRSSNRFMRFWVVTMVLTVPTALAGVGVLGWAFVAGLAK
ncbi:MAG: hypothetical protein H0W40_15535 [Methylibium sp.]|uniref:hypothetical protein n=1 Tax=Methylibium sp. TaxID=2067992 RepID=UPI0017E13121|nr:hypothetical protein [Methylibium sp.]MBA3598771.1 hypothetical protein [Methylibium sp.]